MVQRASLVHMHDFGIHSLSHRGPASPSLTPHRLFFCHHASHTVCLNSKFSNSITSSWTWDWGVGLQFDGICHPIRLSTYLVGGGWSTYHVKSCGESKSITDCQDCFACMVAMPLDWSFPVILHILLPSVIFCTSLILLARSFSHWLGELATQPLLSPIICKLSAPGHSVVFANWLECSGYCE
jgi:hypothetical protein